MRLSHLLAALAAVGLAVACGGSVAQPELFGGGGGEPTGGGGGSGSSVQDTGNPPNEGSPCSAAPPICGFDCGMNGTKPQAQCVNDRWRCVEVKCAPCEGMAKPTCKCGTPTCTGRAWACSPCPGPFACGNTTCNTGEVCLSRAPGIRLEDGGTPPNWYECGKVPAACAGNETCGCVQPRAQNDLMCWGSTCDDKDGHVRLGCMGQ